MRRLKPVFKCKDVEKERFRSSKCLLTISVGQEVHEGPHFQATIDLVNASFASCILLIDDSLQRHTMALSSDKDADSFYKSSIEAGEQWLTRNEVYYGKLEILDKIIRWDRWLLHSHFQAQKNMIMALMASDEAYNDAFTKTVDAFLTRYHHRITNKANFRLERAQQLCLTYLVEECTALCLWTELNCQFEVYPSRRNLAMAETHKKFVLPEHLDLLHAVALKFKNRKQFKPQQLVPIAKGMDKEAIT